MLLAGGSTASSQRGFSPAALKLRLPLLEKWVGGSGRRSPALSSLWLEACTISVHVAVEYKVDVMAPCHPLHHVGLTAAAPAPPGPLPGHSSVLPGSPPLLIALQRQ